MKKSAKVLSLVLAGVMMMSLSACGSKASDTAASAAEKTGEAAESMAEKTADGKQFKIGVLQLVQHAALDATNKGFIKALDEAGLNYTVDQQNASGDQLRARPLPVSWSMTKMI